MTDHRLAWVPLRYTSTAAPRRTHTERPLSALVRVITRSRGTPPPWQAPAPPGGGGDGELAGGGDDAPAGSEEGAPASGGPAAAPVRCWPQPEITATAPRVTAASTGTLRMIAPSGLVHSSRVRRALAGGGSPGPRIVSKTPRLPISATRSGAALPANVRLIRLYPHLSVDTR